MYLVALTGGIAAGKSTVANRWVENGAIAIDADDLAREVVEPGSAGLQQVSEAFGASVLNGDGELDRKALAKVIFEDPARRALLNSILHPLIRERTRDLLEQLRDEEIVVYSVPLLVEAEVDHDFDLVVTVEAPEDVQIGRLVLSRGLSAVEARNRIAAQAKPVERAARANRILNSNQDLTHLLKDADKLWLEIQALAGTARDN